MTKIYNLSEKFPKDPIDGDTLEILGTTFTFYQKSNHWLPGDMKEPVNTAIERNYNRYQINGINRFVLIDKNLYDQLINGSE